MCENRLTFDKVTEIIKVGTFLTHSVVVLPMCWIVPARCSLVFWWHRRRLQWHTTDRTEPGTWTNRDGQSATRDEWREQDRWDPETETHLSTYTVGQKSKPLLIYQYIVLKPADDAIFSLKLNVEQATEENGNRHLFVSNILSIKYSMYDAKCYVNYCVYTYCPSRRLTHPSICYWKP